MKSRGQIEQERRQFYMKKLMRFVDITVLFIFLMGLWHIDITVSALLTDAQVTNGFIVFDTGQRYHVILWFLMMAWFWVAARLTGIVDTELFDGER